MGAGNNDSQLNAARALGVASTAVGYQSTATGDYSVAIGRGSHALQSAIAIGDGANSNQGGTEYNGIAIGKNSTAWSWNLVY